MKAQGMPMQTIAMIIIIIIVLAGVAIFFFVYFGKSKSVVGSQTTYSNCKNLCMNAQSDIEIGTTAACNDFSNIQSKFQSNCSGMHCEITKKDGSTCELPSCSCP